MPFFQNPFTLTFEASLLLGDRHHIPTFIVPENTGRGDEIVTAWKSGPYNLAGNDADGNSKAVLEIRYRLHDPLNWALMSINVTAGAASSSAVTPQEAANALNANALFSERFKAIVEGYNDRSIKLSIKQKKPVTEFNFYIVNGRAESVLGFNARAGVAELPTFFSKHTIENRFIYPESQAKLIELDPSGSDVDKDIIDNAVNAKGVSLGYSSSSIRGDWELLRGKSGLFSFQNGPSSNAVDNSKTEITIVYPAGAKKGDLALKTIVEKDSSGDVVHKFELPYTLDSGDLITPP